MNEQLMLSQDELEYIGFKGKWEAADKLNPSCSWWQIPVVNGFIVYNPNKPPYCWYLKTEIGEAANWIHLDISKESELITILQCFQVNFKYLIK